MFTGIMDSLKVKIIENAKEAIRQGFFYRAPIYKAVRIDEVVVVQKGTESGGSTVDFILEDANGQKYVFMLTGKLLRSIPTEFE